MQLKKVSIKNFKGIEEKTIVFKPGFNLIKGSNGRGKTSMLEAIAVKIAEYEAVKQAVAKFMDIMEESEGHEVFYDKQEEQLMYKVDNTILPITQLSAGYQSLVWMAFDIAYRMAVLNPDKKEHIAETKGIVLIDEIDMHLHPRWQWNIVNALKTVFPNVQFIAATHSPILFAASDDLWLIDVEEGEVNYVESRCGYDANAV